MVRWIALLVFSFFLFTGFTRPALPRASRGIYRLDGYTGPMLKTLSGGVFSLTVGFQRPAQALPHVSLRQQAEVLLDRIEASLANFELSVAEVSVGRIYATTHEIILSVEVHDLSELEAVREQLADKLRATPGVSFVGSPGRVSID